MVTKVESTEQGLVIRVPSEMAQALDLSEGSEVDVLRVSTNAIPRYATVQESLAAFERTLPEHESTYRALAK